MHRLETLPWTGNIRELHNVVERLGILALNPVIDADTVDRLVSRNVPGKDEPDEDPLSGLIESASGFQEFKESAERVYLLRMAGSQRLEHLCDGRQKLECNAAICITK